MQLQFQELQQYKIKNSPNRKSPGPCGLSDFLYIINPILIVTMPENTDRFFVIPPRKMVQSLIPLNSPESVPGGKLRSERK